MTKTRDKTIELLRHLLGSIDLSDVEDIKELSEEEKRAHIDIIGAAFPYIEKDIKKFLYEQLMFSSNQAMDWDQVLVGRGTFNGMDLLLEHWKKDRVEYLAKAQPKDQFDEHNPVGEI